MDDDAELWAKWRAAAVLPAVDAALRELYAALEEQVQKRGPVCWSSGRCCNFDQAGHRLYVTGLEIAWLLHQLPAERKPTSIDPTGSCVFQIGGLCSVHTLRPLGCRVFFCQKGTQDWQHEIYERFLADLRAMHDRLDLPYRYMEWRAGLQTAITTAP